MINALMLQACLSVQGMPVQTQRVLPPGFVDFAPKQQETRVVLLKKGSLFRISFHFCFCSQRAQYVFVFVPSLPRSR